MTVKVSELLGKTLEEVTVSDDKKCVEFKTTAGERYMMAHSQDCCESVSVEDIAGDLSDLVGSPIVQAEESSNNVQHPEDVKFEYPPESFTWTFYRLATAKGQVVIRWLGESNGYYSEDVDFERIT